MRQDAVPLVFAVGLDRKPRMRSTKFAMASSALQYISMVALALATTARAAMPISAAPKYLITL
jgi:hypothetical protein